GFNLVAGGGGGAGASATNTTGNGSPGAGNGGSGGTQTGSQGNPGERGCGRYFVGRSTCGWCGISLGDFFGVTLRCGRPQQCSPTCCNSGFHLPLCCSASSPATPETRRRGGGGGGGAGGGNGGNGNSHGANAAFGSSSGGIHPHRVGPNSDSSVSWSVVPLTFFS
ncbi:MAG: hypothetical protein FWC02_00005, partial [Firmicutes bacterium]|nr:hypothetical protein [Bacillota bacterium]